MRSICGGLIDGVWYDCPFFNNWMHRRLTSCTQGTLRYGEQDSLEVVSSEHCGSIEPTIAVVFWVPGKLRSS